MIGDTGDSRMSKSYVKWVLKKNYDLTGTTEITTCTECGKSKRLCQEYEAPNGEHRVFICEQCAWNLTDLEYSEYYIESTESPKNE